MSVSVRPQRTQRGRLAPASFAPFAEAPAAEFYFAGHSNGTYILGESLRRIPRMQFARIYIAASVLPT